MKASLPSQGDIAIAGTFVKPDGTVSFTGDLNLGGNKIVNVHGDSTNSSAAIISDVNAAKSAVLAVSAQKLFTLSSADMTLTTDQVFTKNFTGTNYVIQKILATWAAGAFSSACAGGIYTAASKGGNALVAASQSYGNMTASGKLVDCTLTSVVSTDVQSVTPILSLTTGNAAALRCNFLIFGYIVD
jgi:hypothetical protein